MWVPRRRPHPNESIPARSGRATRNRITSDGSILRQSARALSGDSASDIGNFFADNSPVRSDIFTDEELVMPRESHVEAVESPNDPESVWASYQRVPLEHRARAAAKFNKQTMDGFDDEAWLFD